MAADTPVVAPSLTPLPSASAPVAVLTAPDVAAPPPKAASPLKASAAPSTPPTRSWGDRMDAADDDDEATSVVGGGDSSDSSGSSGSSGNRNRKRYTRFDPDVFHAIIRTIVDAQTAGPIHSICVHGGSVAEARCQVCSGEKHRTVPISYLQHDPTQTLIRERSAVFAQNALAKGAPQRTEWTPVCRMPAGKHKGGHMGAVCSRGIHLPGTKPVTPAVPEVAPAVRPPAVRQRTPRTDSPWTLLQASFVALAVTMLLAVILGVSVNAWRAWPAFIVSSVLSVPAVISLVGTGGRRGPTRRGPRRSSGD